MTHLLGQFANGDIITSSCAFGWLGRNFRVGLMSSDVLGGRHHCLGKKGALLVQKKWVLDNSLAQNVVINGFMPVKLGFLR